jgi:RNA polymerase-interacting CarD/CdnL/TRCF family regulator
MLCSSLEVLQMLKEKMVVSVPVLEAEMRGLRNGMELEKTKEEVEIAHPVGSDEQATSTV